MCRHPVAAVEATRAAVGEDDANSWLPFNGRDDLKSAVVDSVARRGGPRYDPAREVVITCGEGEAMLDALLCLTDPGDEVILTDPTYAGMLNRVRLVGAVPRLAPMRSDAGEWRVDLDALRVRFTRRSDDPRAARADACKDLHTQLQEARMSQLTHAQPRPVETVRRVYEGVNARLEAPRELFDPDPEFDNTELWPDVVEVLGFEVAQEAMRE